MVITDSFTIWKTIEVKIIHRYHPEVNLIISFILE